MKRLTPVLLGLALLCVFLIVAFPAVRDELDWYWASHRAGVTDYAQYIATWPNGRHLPEAKSLYDEGSWKAAKAENTVEAFKKYLQRHPNGNHAREAPLMMDEKGWEEAKGGNSAEAFEKYIQANPNGRYAAQAKELIEERAWEQARRVNTAESYQDYLSKRPQGKYAKQAEIALDEKNWETAKAANTTESLDNYMRTHPNGRFVQQAQLLIDEKDWQTAQGANTTDALEKYLRDHPGGKYARMGKERIEELLWEDAGEKNGVASYRRYLEKFPNGRFLSEARSRIKGLLEDDSPYLAATKHGTKDAYELFLGQFPGHRRETDARAALKDLAGRDIFDLLAEKKIEVKTEGSGIQSVSLDIRRLVSYPITVKIPVGTFFVSRSTSSQNMVTTEEERVSLPDSIWRSVRVSVACANRPRDIPGTEDSFTIRRSPQQKELEKLMPVLDKAGVEFAVRQAAVWIVTDNADFDDLGSLVSRPMFQPFGGERVIQEEHAANAMKICDEAGIEITKKAIWQDRIQIMKVIKDEVLKNWIQQRAKK